MKWEQYVVESARTVAGHGKADSLDHAVIGYFTECGEFVDQYKKHMFYGRELDKTNLIEELGDMCWYLALAERHGRNLIKHGLLIKYESTDDIVEHVMKHSNLSIYSALLVKSLCKYLDLSFEGVLEANIAKLKKRYPEKFVDVVVRDYKAEASMIEEVINK